MGGNKDLEDKGLGQGTINALRSRPWPMEAGAPLRDGV